MKYSNGVEARVGDVFRIKQTSVIVELNSVEQIALYARTWYQTELIHRPFQAGDDVEIHTRRGWFSGEGYKLKVNKESPKHDHIKIRHANSLWRDHPDYVMGEL